MFVGLDVHKKYCFSTVLDEDESVVFQGRFMNTLEDLDHFLEKLDGSSEVAIEACGIWEPLYDYLETRGLRVSVAHPLKTRAIASARIKTDKIDSQTLAHLKKIRRPSTLSSIWTL